MITEDFCSFEVAKLLKEKGFDELCIFKYSSEGVRMKAGVAIDEWQNSEFDEDECSCPSQSMAMKWLRTKDIIFVPQPEYFNAESKCLVWGVDIWTNDNYEKVQADFLSYEEAVEAALKYCLENLI